MGFDVSFHPVDVKFIRDRVVSYVRGNETLADILPDMVRVEKVRHRTAEWALKVIDLDNKEFDRRRRAEEKSKSVPSGRATRKAPASLLPDWFDSHLHVWGRPFFITVETPEEVADTIDRYLSLASDVEVDELVREQIRRLNPKLVDRIKPPKVHRFPSDRTMLLHHRNRLDRFRECLQLHREGRPYVDEDGEEQDAGEELAFNLPLEAVSFASVLCPGWMSRGYVWPTHLLEEAGLSSEFFELAQPLFTPLLRSVEAFEESLENTIIENYMIGGFVRPGRVRALRRYLAGNQEQIVTKLDYAAEELRKIDEALCYAQRHGLGFVEATEVYSGIMGIMN